MNASGGWEFVDLNSKYVNVYSAYISIIPWEGGSKDLCLDESNQHFRTSDSG
jgi:hypothetical protein